MSTRLARRSLRWLLAIPLLISVGFNVFMVHSIVANLRLTPQGVVSDLYPSWRGTRDRLLHGTNPYLASQTAEYQRGYYGKVPDDASIGGGVGYQGFVYPLFLCVILAPLAIIPFGVVQWIAILGLLAVIVWVTRAWTGLVGWPRGERNQWIAGLVWAGAAPSLYLVSLQQLTGLAVLILGLTAVAVARRQFGLAGVLLAIGMFKPQLTLLVLLGVAIWALRQRRLVQFARGFVLSGVVLLGSSLALQPDWPRWFFSQVQTYAQTNQMWGVLSVFPNGMARTAAMGAIVLLSLVAGGIPWGPNADASADDRFVEFVALLVAATLILNQGVLVYNAVLLLFPLAVIVRRCARHRSGWVRLPSDAALGMLGLSLVSGIAAAALMALGRSGGAGVATDVMGFGFIAAALPMWLSLIALHLTAAADGVALPLPIRFLSRS